MDTRMTYPDGIKKFLNDYAELFNDDGGTSLKLLFDDERKSYMLLNVGWRGRNIFTAPPSMWT